MRHTHHDAVVRYITDTFVTEDAALESIRAKGEALRAGMQVSPMEGKLLYTLATIIGAKRILELGTFVGYSTVWLARALPDDGTLVTVEYEPRHAAIANDFFQYAGVSEKITLLEGKALEMLDKITNEQLEPFDLVFIDATKHEYPDYLIYINKLLRKGGLLVADNTLLFGAMIGQPEEHVSAKAEEAMRRFNHVLGEGIDYTSILIPTEEGLTVACKK